MENLENLTDDDMKEKFWLHLCTARPEKRIPSISKLEAVRELHPHQGTAGPPIIQPPLNASFPLLLLSIWNRVDRKSVV